MTDYDTLKDVFELAEVLTNETESTLELLTVDESSNKSVTIVFSFNKKNELMEVYVEE